MRTLLLLVAFSMGLGPAMAQSNLGNVGKRLGKQMLAKPNVRRYRLPTVKPPMGLTYEKVREVFDRLPWYDNCGIMKQVGGYGWIFTTRGEEKNEFFPIEVTYRLYPLHPDLRQIGPCLFDKEGQLKAVILLTSAFNDDLEYTDRASGIRDCLVDALKIMAYKNGNYEVNRATEEQRHEIEYRLGLRATRTDLHYEEVERVKNYCSKLQEDAEDQIDGTLRVTRLDSTTFKVLYADKTGRASIPVTISFHTGDKPYTTAYTYDFPGRSEVQRLKRQADEEKKAVEAASEAKEDCTFNGEPVFDVVEVAPQYPGDLYKWVNSNLHYPAIAKENGIQGTVTVSFTVCKDGTIANAKVVRGVDRALDREALRLVSSMHRWTPGRQNGRTVNVRYLLPIRFRLE